MRHFTITITTICLLLVFSRLQGQGTEDTPDWFSKHPVDLSFGHASVGMPVFGISVKPFYPMVSLGTEFYYKQKEHSDFFQSAKINYYYAKYSTSSIVLNSEMGYRYKLNSGLYAEGALGIGYAQLFRPGAIYKLNDQKEYEQKRDYGKPCFMADFAISVGYDFSVKKHIPFSLYLKYGSYIDILYAPDIPVFPHNILQVGARFYIHHKNN
jgi:hypothetical protein